MPEEIPRAEHLAWCKQRALEYVDAGDLTNAVASMQSDMRKHPETIASMNVATAAMGFLAVQDGKEAVRRWIEGFG